MNIKNDQLCAKRSRTLSAVLGPERQAGFMPDGAVHRTTI